MKYKVTAYGAWIRKYATWAGEGGYDYHEQGWPAWRIVWTPLYTTIRYE